MDQFLNQLQQGIINNLLELTEIIFGIIFILIAFEIINRFLKNYIKDPKLRSYVRQGLRGVQLLFILMFIGLVFSPSVRHLFFSFSALSAVFAFMFKELSSSLSGWIAITFGGLYKHGDRVQIGNTVGDIMKIGFTQTTLMECGEWLEGDSYTGRIVHVNNSNVVQEFIFNYSDQFPFIWDAVWIPLDYSSDRALAKNLIEETITEVVDEQVKAANQQWSKFPHQSVLTNVSFAPKVHLKINQDYMEFKVTYIVDYRQRGGIKHEFLTRLLERIDNSNQQMKFPIQVIQLLNHETS